MTEASQRHIVILIPSLRPGGAERNCIKLANAFFGRNHKVSIWIRERSPNDLASKLDPSISINVIGGGGVYSTSRNIFFKIKKSEVDAFLVFNYYWLIPVLLANFLFAKKTKVTFRVISELNKQLSHLESLPKKLLGYFYLKVLARFADNIIAQCEAMRADAAKFMLISQNRITTIYNPMDRIQQSPETLRHHEVLFVGRLIPLKGLDYLIESFAILAKTDQLVRLRIVGDGPIKGSLQKKIVLWGLQERIIFEGYQQDVSSFYKKAKVTVLTSLYEGFPNVLVESISYGTPIVSFDCKTGPSEIIVEGVNGYLVKLKDVHALAEKLRLALRSENFVQETVVATSRKFELDVIADRYLQILLN